MEGKQPNADDLAEQPNADALAEYVQRGMDSNSLKVDYVEAGNGRKIYVATIREDADPRMKSYKGKLIIFSMEDGKVSVNEFINITDRKQWNIYKKMVNKSNSASNASKGTGNTINRGPQNTAELIDTLGKSIKRTEGDLVSAAKRWIDLESQMEKVSGHDGTGTFEPGTMATPEVVSAMNIFIEAVRREMNRDKGSDLTV